MEVLLLDTTEKEGEDNLLYHYVYSTRTVGCFSTNSKNTDWLDLRGVLAAAVGATTSLCGELLRFARFGGGSTNGSTGIVGFVNIYEVLYALIFAADIPESIIQFSMTQYYTRSSCDLLLGFFGYPDAKLSQWRRQEGFAISASTLKARLDTFFKGILSAIHRDLSFGSSLHFTFDGCVPAVNYPLETMTKLAILDVPLGESTPNEQYCVIGRCIFYRKQLVFSTMRNDFLRLLSQWLLVDDFVPDTSSSEGSTRIDIFELHDFRFTRHGEYPKCHALLIISHNQIQVQLAFLVERKPESNAVEWAKHLANDVNQRSVEDLAEFCARQFELYLKSSQEFIHHQMEKLGARFCTESGRFLWYSVAVDRLRGIILADDLHSNQNSSIMKRFIQYLATYQNSRCLHEACVERSPEYPSGIPPLKLNNDPHALFLREKSTDAGDISTGETRIFPEVNNSIKNKGRKHRQSAEQIIVDGQLLWIIATSYETLDFFSIVDAELPLELLDEEFDRLCAFGGARKVAE
ncbi:hypothetical protein P3T76_007371 [Phytophthora citrophthora]|uniref:Uncharacterized protein n=1 Tax=Phytophthora citrophthora TaxID=4793 RepID=A0AAD9GN56_9STRA|nr:hypothetical protein P3T76_007371 [Phytophthora citrophthora]